MEDTIEKALTSVLLQLDESFEMIVVDESKDLSREILTRMEKEYPSLRCVFLEPNRNRTISEARNISVRESKGDYCLLHIDCDDIWEPYLDQFIKVFHSLESIIPRDFLLAGQQVNMGKREFLLMHGPYRNGATGEDRDMWMRLAKMNAYYPMNHVPFFHRMSLPNKTHKIKALKRNYYSIREGIRAGASYLSFLGLLYTNPGKLSPVTRIYNFLVYPLAFLHAKYLGVIDTSDYFENIDEWNRYKVENGGTFLEIAGRFNPSANLEFLSLQGKWLFSNKRYEKTFIDMQNELNFDLDV